jgi:hypothetical protein
MVTSCPAELRKITLSRKPVLLLRYLITHRLLHVQLSDGVDEILGPAAQLLGIECKLRAWRLSVLIDFALALPLCLSVHSDESAGALCAAGE